MYDKLVSKVKNIDTAGFALKNKYDTDKSDLEKTIRDADKKNSALTTVENKIPDISTLGKKTGYNRKIRN